MTQFNYRESGLNQTGHPKHDDSVIVSDRNCGSCCDDEFNSPLYPFGYGLSYTTFEYSEFTLSTAEFSREGRLSQAFTRRIREITAAIRAIAENSVLP